MTASFGALVLKVGNIDRAAKFWSSALGYAARPGNPALLFPEGGTGTALHLDEQDRTHMDLYVSSRGSLEAEVDRMIALGATRPAWTYPRDADFVVLADTEGNLFCVVDSKA